MVGSFFELTPAYRRSRFAAVLVSAALGSAALGSLPAAPVPSMDTAQANLPGICPGQVPAPGFMDVPDANVHRQAVDCVAWYEVAHGTEATRFSPDGGVRRDQMASFLARVLEWAGHPLPPAPADHFDDDGGNTHEQAINQLAALGVVRGVNARSYAPAQVVRRDQMASFLVRAYEAATSRALPSSHDHFGDDDGSVHEQAINQAAGAGIAVGVSAQRFEPARPVRRDQMASLVARLMETLSVDHPPAGTPVVERVVPLELDGSGDVLDGHAVAAAPAGSLVTVVGRHFPPGAPVLVGGEETTTLAFGHGAIITVLPLRQELPETVTLAVTGREPSVVASVSLTITAPPPLEGDAEQTITEFIEGARGLLAMQDNDAATALRQELERLEGLLADLSEHERQLIATGLQTMNAAAILALLAEHEQATAAADDGVSALSSHLKILVRFRSLRPNPLLRLVTEASKHFNAGPALKGEFDTLAPVEGRTHGFSCTASDGDGLTTSSPALTMANGDARFIDPQSTGTGAVTEWTQARRWTAPVTGNLRVVAIRCEATDTPKWAHARTTRQDFPVVVRETLSPKIQAFTTHKEASPPETGQLAQSFEVGERFNVVVRATDDVNPDSRFGYEPFGIREVRLSMSQHLRVANRWSFLEQTVSASGTDLLVSRYPGTLGFRGDFHYFVDPHIRHSGGAKGLLTAYAALECRSPGSGDVTLTVGDFHPNPAVSSSRDITCTEQTLPSLTVKVVSFSTGALPASHVTVAPDKGAYEVGEHVNLTATPHFQSGGYDHYFTFWDVVPDTAVVSELDNTLTVAMDEDVTVTAFYESTPS